jgi:hypothetical protein
MKIDAMKMLEATPEALAEAVVSMRARRAVEAIVRDLSDRRGLKHEWWQIDPDIRADIKRQWQAIIMEALR